MRRRGLRAFFGVAVLAVLAAVLLPVSVSPPASAATTQAAAAFAAMTRAERVGQLLMIGCPSTVVSSACLSTLPTRHVGSVILTGNSYLSISQEHSVTAGLQQAAPAHRKLFIATDQEGGLVRRMR